MNLVAEIQANNIPAFEEVYHRFHERFYYYILGRTASEDMAEEIVQKAFIRLWEYRASLSPDLAIEIQLARIARTILIDTLRRKAVERRAIRHIEGRTPAVSAEDPLLAKELNQRIIAAIESLPPVCRKIFRLSREEGLTYQEIASLLSISTKTVENQMSKALRLVRQMVGLYIVLAHIQH